MISVSYAVRANSNTTDITPAFSRVHVAQILVFCVVLCTFICLLSIFYLVTVLCLLGYCIVYLVIVLCLLGHCIVWSSMYGF